MCSTTFTVRVRVAPWIYPALRLTQFAHTLRIIGQDKAKDFAQWMCGHAVRVNGKKLRHGSH